MKTTIKILWGLLLLIPLFASAQAKEIPFTLDDRDRIVRTEQKVEAVKTEMNARFEAIDKRFDQLFNFLWAIIGIFTTMMVAVFGFAFWDRKLALAPLKREDQRILGILIDFSRSEPRLSEILRKAGLL